MRFEQLTNCLPIKMKNIHVVYTSYGTARFYIIILQDKHMKIINEKLSSASISDMQFDYLNNISENKTQILMKEKQ